MAQVVKLGASAPPSVRVSLLADVNGANVTAGLTAALFYLFGAIPLQLGAVAKLGLPREEAASWFFITFLTSAVSSLFLSLRYRQPLPVGWTIPGLIFLATTGGRYNHAELTGAVMVAGVLMVALGLLGAAERFLRWVPLPIVMGMFAGNVFGYVTGVFDGFGTQPWPVGAAIAGYLVVRALGRNWLPPMAGAFAAGLGAAIATGQVRFAGIVWSAPIAAPIRPAFDAGSILALSLPLVIMAVGMGNVQGIGYLIDQGYRPPVRLLTVWVGVTTLINAAFGGHTSTIQNNGAAVLGGPDAGPRDGRYVACAIASSLAVVLALGATMASAVIGVLPAGLVAALTGLAILTAALEAVKKAVGGDLPLGAFFAFAIAASSFTLGGIGPAFWALLGGLLVSLLAERSAVVGAWRVTP
jgi:benzoate membrane transport protein